MQRGLIVELLDTDLEDFATHTNWGVKHFTTWYGLDEPLGDASVIWQEEETHPGLLNITGIAKSVNIKIDIHYSGHVPLIHTWVGRLRDIMNPEGLRYADMFHINAVRYRRSRIQVVFIDEGDDQFRGGENFTEWLEFNCGDAVQTMKVVDTTSMLKQLAYLQKTEVQGGGRPPIRAHANAIKRLREGESKTMNFSKWQVEYEKETRTHPDNMTSGASELYRKNVWDPFNEERQKGKN